MKSSFFPDLGSLGQENHQHGAVKENAGVY